MREGCVRVGWGVCGSLRHPRWHGVGCRCMEAHKGKAPDRYEGEWCIEQSVLYKLCREELQEARAKDAGKAAGK